MNTTHAPVVNAAVSTSVPSTATTHPPYRVPTTTELDRLLEGAIERATRNGIEVVAKGFRIRDHARCYFTTSSSDAQRWHTVVRTGKRLQCDCPAGRYATHVCQHRAAVYMHLAVEAALADIEARKVGGLLFHDAVIADLHGAPTPDAPRLPDDTRAIGIFK